MRCRPFQSASSSAFCRAVRRGSGHAHRAAAEKPERGSDKDKDADDDSNNGEIELEDIIDERVDIKTDDRYDDG